jgi:GR25 family glycosyltransferase involved in LPS biosynthesis
MMKKIKDTVLIGLLILTSNHLLPNYLHAEVLERIVAIVNDDVILQSEFLQAYESAREYDPDAHEAGVLEEMINRLLLLKEARKFRLTASDNEQGEAKDDKIIIKEYIDIRLKGFIHVPYEDIEYYYYQNKDSFSGRDFYDVRNEIEEYLIEQEFNVKLIEYIEDLKRNAYIRTQLGTDL